VSKTKGISLKRPIDKFFKLVIFAKLQICENVRKKWQKELLKKNLTPSKNFCFPHKIPA
jgi:hypothetical protein